MEVIEPAIVSLTVKDPRFVNAIESCFSAAQMKVNQQEKTRLCEI